MSKRLIISCIFVFISMIVFSQNITYLSNEKIRELEKDSVSKQYPLISWEYSYIGEYQKSLKAYDDFSKLSNQPFTYQDLRIATPYATQNAKEFIIEKAAKERIVIINEAHHEPMHRVFTESLLEDLYKNGFRFLALEALVSDSKVNKSKVLTVNDGYYTKEPQFSNLINKALSLGYYVFGYEYTEGDISRELGQAKNIYRMMQEKSDGKFLIHCGFGHVVEENHLSGITTMAQHLKSLSGINPLTIDQVMFSERVYKEAEHPLYSNVVVDFPTILSDLEGHVLNLNGNFSIVDVRVIHPRTNYKEGRPDWLYRNGSWKSHYVDFSNLSVEYPCRIFAYKQGTFSLDNVPIDIIEIDSPNHKALVLPKGKFTLYIVDNKENTNILEVEN